MQTGQEYYNDRDSWGSYQYVTLTHIIDDLILQSQDEDSYLKNTKRSFFLRHAKAGIKSLNKSVGKDVKVIELTIGDDLRMVMPQDYVDYVRISMVSDDDECSLLPLNINNKCFNTAQAYLQDHEYNIIFDSDGNPIEVDGRNVVNNPYTIYEFNKDYYGGQFQLDTSKLAKYGEFSINERGGVIYFSSNLSGKDVVVEYLSDGLNWETINQEEIKVHKYLEEALIDYIYFKVIERRKSVPANEKERALRRMKTTIHKAKIDRANFDLQEMARVARGAMKWVKT